MPDLYIPDFSPCDYLETDKKTGRPRKFKTPEELQVKIKAFFSMCYDKSLHPTITGLAIFLETTRKTLMNYKNDTAFYPLIKKAKETCGHYLEQRAISGAAVAGEIFLMKANHGYREERDITLNVSLDVDKLYAKSLKTANSPQLAESATKKLNTVEIIDIEPSNDAGLQ